MPPSDPITPGTVLHQLRSYRSSHRSTLSRRTSRNYEVPGTTLTDELGQTVYDPNLVQNSGEFYNLDANGQPYYGTDGKTQTRVCLVNKTVEL